MRESNRLTALKIAKLRRPGLYADGNGLCLQVQDGPTKSWVLRYMLARRPRKMGLGPLALVSLAQAREKALGCRKLLLAGIDPLKAREVERADAAAEALRTITFHQCAERYIADHRSSWKNAKHAAQWEATIATYAEPILGALAVQDVDTTAVMRVLEQEVLDKAKKPKPLWQAHPDTASRLRGRIEQVLNWATARGYRTGENPARWRGHIDNLLPSRAKLGRVKHHSALPYKELSEFMTAVRAREGISSRALEFTILTAARTGEVIGARWDELDFDARMWVIPGVRMKSGREHRVPLSDRAIEILSEMPKQGEFVFSGRQPETALSNMAMLQMLKKMGRGDLTTHGFRSTFRDWSAEQTAYPHELLEMALAHIVSDKTVAAYARSDMLEKRRKLMVDWAAYCQMPPQKSASVVPIRVRQ